MITRPAHQLIGHEGEFRLPGGRAVYEGVMFNEARAKSDRVRLARLDTSGPAPRQINRYVDWDQPVEVLADYDAEDLMPAHAWRGHARYIGRNRRREVYEACIICGVEARCGHDATPLDPQGNAQWICPKCGAEWHDDHFGECRA